MSYTENLFPYGDFTSIEHELQYWINLINQDIEEVQVDSENAKVIEENDTFSENLFLQDNNGTFEDKSSSEEDDPVEVSFAIESPSYLGPFRSFELALEYSRYFASSYLFEFVKRRSDPDGKGSFRKCELICDKGRKPASTLIYPKSADKQQRNDSSKRIDYQFSWYIGRKKGQFFIIVKNNIHKHRRLRKSCFA